MIEALQDGPITCAIDAGPIVDYTSGIVSTPTVTDPNKLDHEISIVGYATDSATGKDYWLVRNSWGTSWGE
jgi:cathepsin L